MADTEFDLNAIRQRHEFDVRTARFSRMRVREHNTHDDRGALLAEVDRLATEVDRLRDLVAYTGTALVNAGNSLAKSDGEVDRLTAELAEVREAYDAVCRSIGASLRGSAAE